MDFYVSWVSRCPGSRWRRTEKRQWSASYMLNIGVSKAYQETSSACARIASCHVDLMANFGQHFQEREWVVKQKMRKVDVDVGDRYV